MEPVTANNRSQSRLRGVKIIQLIPVHCSEQGQIESPWTPAQPEYTGLEHQTGFRSLFLND